MAPRRNSASSTSSSCENHQHPEGAPPEAGKPQRKASRFKLLASAVIPPLAV
jgi:hypothetical protein